MSFGFYPFNNIYELFLAYAEYFKGKRLPAKINGFTLEILLLEAYYDIFGIIDLDTDRVPMPLVWYTNADTVGELGPLSEYILDYKINQVNEQFGLSLYEYLNLPINIACVVLAICKTENEFDKEIKNNIVDDMSKQERELNRMLNK